MGISAREAALVAAAILLSGCATTPKRFYDNPGAVKDASLCRALFETTDQQFRFDLAAEGDRRGLTVESCQKKVQEENAAIAAVALVGVAATAVAVCSNGGCAGGAPSNNYSYAGPDYDCRGGSGNGPYYVSGPVHVGWNDPHDLDRDGDGIGCEVSDYRWGA